MELIEFKNLPDTSTPINENNLNNNFNELDRRTLKADAVSFNSYNEFGKLYADLVANKNKTCTGEIGNQHSTNLKTLLGDPNIGNYTNCIFEVLTNNQTDGCVRITAFAPYTSNVRIAYLIVAGSDIQYTGWQTL